MKVALVHSGGAAGEAASRLHEALVEAGHEPVVIGGPGRGLPERLLERRGFTTGLSALPPALRSLGVDEHDVAHAFGPVAATAALVWGRRNRAPVVCSFTESIDRGTVADRRLRLKLLRAALEETDAVLATTAEARAALLRWAAVDAPVLRPDDAQAHVSLYRRLLGARPQT